jgi:hypothetical protein
MDIFLAQLLGLYFVVVGAIVLVRGKSLLPAVGVLGKDKGLMVVIGAVELVAGIALVLAYPVVDMSPVGLISLIGYVLAIEGVVYLGSTTVMQGVIRKFNHKKWYTAGGVVAIAMGAYLLNFGFGLGYF